MLTWISVIAFFIEAVPLKATTMVSSFQPIRQRVSNLVSQKSSCLVSLYILKALERVRVVLGVVLGVLGGFWEGLGEALQDGNWRDEEPRDLEEECFAGV